MNTHVNRKQPATRKRFFLALSLLVISILIAAFLPWNAWALTSNSHPVQSYEEATKQIDVLRTDRQSEMNPDCLLQLLTHGKKVQHVIILVHGYTNCPAQFGELGQQFYELGYNVLIAPLPHHGLANRINDEQGQLTGKELAAYADQVVDIAHGLGEHVDMAGISAGGVVTAWAAQYRSDLDTAMIISPAFGFQQIPTRLTAPAMNITSLLPDSFTWWDPNLKEDVAPFHTYPRYSKHALAQIMRIGFAVQVKSWISAPAAHRIIIVTNANDTSVNNMLTAEVVRRWQRSGLKVETYEFPISLGLDHDLIDPDQPHQPVDIVYPQLIALITHED
jgi:alpha-beta hydrolase superfamily lysophospholipase